MIIIANVGITRNLAQSLLLYTKISVFTEKYLPDFSIRYITARLYANRVFCIFCKFLQICRKSIRSLLSMKMKKNNQTLRNQNAELPFHISEPSFFAVYCIRKHQKIIHRAKNSIIDSYWNYQDQVI